ncbi:hypothetical protein JB92DRAFT_2958600 [Gautieria morchelliformis]|nr:hypothetical protein JB92DRAFT_2958600 [Gautieria morchelliformis]
MSQVFSDTKSTSLAVALFAVTALAFYRRVLRPPPTPFWGEDLALLGVTRDVKYRGTAVVCGASVSGTLTARICADHFDKVILVDSPGQAKTRSYQQEHPHAYLIFMLDVLARLWPSFLQEAEHSGGVRTPADFQIHHGGISIPAPHKAFPSAKLPETILLRRATLDALLHRLLFRHQSNVKRYLGTVVRLNPSQETKRRLGSVVVRSTDGVEEIIEDPALVVDCTGGLQAGLKWLPEAGYNLADNLRTSYDPKTRYFTTTFTVSDELKGRLPIPGGYSQAGAIYGFGADVTYGNTGFVITRMDNDTILVCCFGWGKFDVPKTVDDIIQHVRSVQGPGKVPTWVLELVEILSSEAQHDCKYLRLSPCSFIKYHTAPNIPSNFVAVGDSLLQLNPAFGQGCSKAAIQVTALNALLSRPHRPSYLPDDFSQTFFRRSAEYLEPVWDATKAIDYGYPSTTPISGEAHSKGAFIRWYMTQVMLAAIHNLNVSLVMFNVQMFSAPGTSLISPSILWSVGSASLKRFLQSISSI